jgi:serine/threonine-protein kinase RsbW
MKNALLEIKFYSREGFKVIRDSVKEYLKKYLAEDYILMEVALHEAVNNSLKHGYVEGENQEVTLTLAVTKRKLLVAVKDSGPGFNVMDYISGYEKMDTAKFLYQESGRGLLIMKKASDSVYYNKKGNKVILIKHIKKTM